MDLALNRLNPMSFANCLTQKNKSWTVLIYNIFNELNSARVPKLTTVPTQSTHNSWRASTVTPTECKFFDLIFSFKSIISSVRPNSCRPTLPPSKSSLMVLLRFGSVIRSGSCEGDIPNASISVIFFHLSYTPKSASLLILIPIDHLLYNENKLFS